MGVPITAGRPSPVSGESPPTASSEPAFQMVHPFPTDRDSNEYREKTGAKKIGGIESDGPSKMRYRSTSGWCLQRAV